MKMDYPKKINNKKLSLIDLFPYAVVTLLGTSITLKNDYLLLVSIAIPLVLVLFIKHEWALWALVISLFSLDWLAEQLQLLPQQITWLIDIFIIVLFAKGLYCYFMYSGKIKLTSIDLVIFATFSLLILSSLANWISPITVAISFRRSFKYMLIFYAIRLLPISSTFLKRFFMVIIILTVLQVPIAMIQFFGAKTGLISMLSDQTIGDFIGGTLGGSTKGELALLTITIMTFFISRYLLEGKFFYLLTAFFLIIPSILVKATFLFLPVVLSYLLLRNLSRFPRRVMFCMAFIGAVMIFKVLTFNFFAESKIHDFLHYDAVVAYSTGMYGSSDRLGRMEAIITARDLVNRDDAYKRILGFGPGSASQSYFASHAGIFEKSYRGIHSTQISSTLLELGNGGLFLLFLLYLVLFITSLRLSPKLQDDTWKAYNLTFQCAIILAILASGYTNVTIECDIMSFIFWLFPATLLKITPRHDYSDERESVLKI